MTELTLPALIALIGALLICSLPWIRTRRGSLQHLLKAGALVGGVDLIVELIGTYTGGWTYHSSRCFIFGTVPIELPILFTSSGVWLGGKTSMSW